MIREYSLGGRLLGQRRFRTGTKSYSFSMFTRGLSGYVMQSSVNMDNRGPDSLVYEYYNRQGELYRYSADPLLKIQSSIVLGSSPEHFIGLRVQQINAAGPWLYTVIHMDTSLNVRREDTVGYLGASYGFSDVILLPNGRYIVSIPQTRDTIRTRLFFFDHPGIFSKALLMDSGSSRYLPLADGGVLSFEGTYVSNVSRKIDSLRIRGLPYQDRSSFSRRSATWQLLWTLDVSNLSNDSISSSFTPLASIPFSPEDAVFIGRRVVSSRVQSEPWGTFGLVGRIDGVGTIFDPTSTKGPREAVSYLEANLYPNPATERIYIDSDKPLAYRILSAMGALVQQGIVSRSQPAELAALVPGIYQLLLSDGTQTTRRRFVKQ